MDLSIGSAALLFFTFSTDLSLPLHVKKLLLLACAAISVPCGRFLNRHAEKED